MKFRGRLSQVQCNRSKCAIFGIKFLKLCESSFGCFVNCRICTGNDLLEGSDRSASKNVVLELTEPVLGKGYTGI